MQYAASRTKSHLLRFRELALQVEAGAVDEAWLERLETQDNIFPQIAVAAAAGPGAAERRMLVVARAPSSSGKRLQHQPWSRLRDSLRWRSRDMVSVRQDAACSATRSHRMPGVRMCSGHRGQYRRQYDVPSEESAAVLSGIGQRNSGLLHSRR